MKRAMPLEEGLVLPKYGRNQDQRDIAGRNGFQCVVPIIILHNNYQTGLNSIQQTGSVALCIQWQVKNKIGVLIILGCFVTRWWKNADQNFMWRKILFQRFYKWFGLFKFSCWSGMKPNDLAWRKIFSQVIPNILSSLNPFFCLWVPKSRNANCYGVEKNEKIIKPNQLEILRKPCKNKGKLDPKAYFTTFAALNGKNI